jgi:hypothetical protein
VEMTTPEPEDNFGTPRFVTASAFLRIDNPRGGKVLDIYGAGRPVPASAVSDPKVRQHLLDKGLIEHVDDRGNVDKWRCVEALTAIIATDCEVGWGRPRIAEHLRSQGFKYSNRTLGIAIRMFNSDWTLGDPLPSERG